MELNDVNLLCMNCFKQLAVQGETCPACGYREAEQEISPHLLRPRTILGGKYLLGNVLGQGGFGITYIGWDINLQLKVAIKEYYPTGFVSRETTATTTVQPFAGKQGEFFLKGKERFIGEARSLAKFFNLPGIVLVKDYFQENGTAYIVMAYIEGQTLKSYLKQNGGKVSVERALELLRPIVTALTEIHKSGLIHRDIGPDNIMMSYDGDVRLLDFGAAREFADSGNKSLSIMLKPGYAPEEQYRSKGVQGPWTDIYALCATIYKCITGTTPDESLDRMQQDTLVPPSELGVDITPAQEAALFKGLAIKQADRFQSVPELYAAMYEDHPAASRHPSKEGNEVEPVGRDVLIAPPEEMSVAEPDDYLTPRSDEDIAPYKKNEASSENKKIVPNVISKYKMQLIAGGIGLVVIIVGALLIPWSLPISTPVRDETPGSDTVSAEQTTAPASEPTLGPVPEPELTPIPEPTPNLLAELYGQLTRAVTLNSPEIFDENFISFVINDNDASNNTQIESVNDLQYLIITLENTPEHLDEMELHFNYKGACYTFKLEPYRIEETNTYLVDLKQLYVYLLYRAWEYKEIGIWYGGNKVDEFGTVDAYFAVDLAELPFESLSREVTLNGPSYDMFEFANFTINRGYENGTEIPDINNYNLFVVEFESISAGSYPGLELHIRGANSTSPVNYNPRPHVINLRPYRVKDSNAYLVDLTKLDFYDLYLTWDWKAIGVWHDGFGGIETFGEIDAYFAVVG